MAINWEWVLGIIAALFGGTSIFQFFFYRYEKEKAAAEAKSATADAHQKDIDLQQDQYNFLLEKLNKYQEDYFTMGEKLQEETRKRIELINKYCEEISQLKAQLTRYRDNVCFRSGCPKRIVKNESETEE